MVSALWFCLLCLPAPWIVLTITGKKLSKDCDNDECSFIPKNDKKANKSILGAIKQYLFYTKNPILQLLLCCILFGGYASFLLHGYQHLDSEFHKVGSICVISLCIFTLLFAMWSSPGVIIAPTNKKYCPMELQELEPSAITLSPALIEAARQRFEHHWERHIGKYPYDNITHFPNTWCSDCNQPRPARSKHCKLCGICVARHDHHCWYLGTCIGADNYGRFILLVTTHGFVLETYGLWLMYHAAACLTQNLGVDQSIMTYLGNPTGFWQRHIIFGLYRHQWLAQHFPSYWITYLLLTILSIPVFLFACYHVYLAITNQTSSEQVKRSYVEKWLAATSIRNPKLEQQWMDEEIAYIKNKMNPNATQEQKEQQQKEEIQQNTKTIEIEKEKQQVELHHNPQDIMAGCIPSVPTPEQPMTTEKQSQEDKKEEEQSSQKIEEQKPKQQINRPIRNPFAVTIIPERFDEQYYPSQPEVLLFEHNITKRPNGYKGWYEPQTCPLVTTNNTTITDKKQIIPQPLQWARAYFVSALSSNIYNTGSIWTNIKDALFYDTPQITHVTLPDGQKVPAIVPYEEYDLEYLLKLRYFAFKQFNLNEIVVKESKEGQDQTKPQQEETQKTK